VISHDDESDALGEALSWLRARLAGDAGPHLTGPPTLPSLAGLGERLGLTAFEQAVLLLCLGHEFDPSLGALMANVPEGPGLPFPTFALALRTLPEPRWDSVSPHRPLRFWRLVELQRRPGAPLVCAELRADERIVHLVRGLDGPDERLLHLLSPTPDVEPGLSTAQGVLADEIAAAMARGMVAQLAGDHSEAARVAASAARRAGLRLLRLEAGRLPADPVDLALVARLCQREMLIGAFALCFDGTGLDDASVALAQDFLESLGVPAVVIADRISRRSGNVFRRVVERPTRREQRALWQDLVGDRAAAVPERFDLGFATIERIAARISAEEPPERACLLETAPDFGRLARRIEARAGLDELVLPERERDMLRRIVLEARHRRTVLEDWGFRQRSARGLGLATLFLGESGTGKTLAAEIIARELELDLIAVDLSAVVDKYVGETEKNLARIFDAASSGGMLLLFDEADALFGKRTEVKDSHDRFANTEISYLLHRMELFEGVSILTSNMKAALDVAFLRRLRYVVNFPFPGPAERAIIWQRIWPAETPVEALDHESLARFNLSGGNIRSAALGAAYIAAAAGRPVTMPIVLAAVRDELRRLERPVHEADFAYPGKS
jgi:SpoVK/Ycf46/Vps4 family AAA+-type ATPase